MLISLGLNIQPLGKFLTRLPILGLPYQELCALTKAACRTWKKGYLIQTPTFDLVKGTLSDKEEREILKTKAVEYRDLVDKDQNNAKALTNLGESLRRLGDADNALRAKQAHEKALAIDPNLVPALIGIALAEADLNNLEAANQAIEKAIEKDPTNVVIYIYQAEILYLQQDFSGAETALEKAKEIDPSDGEVIKNLSDILAW